MIIRKLSKEIRQYQEIDSTNREMNRLLMRDNLAEGTVIQAAYQHSGRGNAGNSWQSERGMNLLFSILLIFCPRKMPSICRGSPVYHCMKLLTTSVME